MGFHEVFQVELEAISPYNFELTVHKPAGWWWSTPDETFERNTLWTATRFKNVLVGLRLKSHGTMNKPRIACTVFSAKTIGKEAQQELTQMLQRALRIEEDLSEFYALAKKDDILREVVADLRGMHTVAWPELFPALILAVTLQMAPMKRSDQMMDLLMENFGDRAHFDRQIMRYWPSPNRIADASVEELRSKVKLGYRATNLVAISKALETGFPTMDELYALKPEEAKKKLLTLRGIGEYSAELVMPGMGFPLDVWSAKIFSILLFGKESENPREAIPALKKEAEARWGKWRGYAFVYVLNDLPRLSKKVGFDLTRF